MCRTCGFLALAFENLMSKVPRDDCVLFTIMTLNREVFIDETSQVCLSCVSHCMHFMTHVTFLILSSAKMPVDTHPQTVAVMGGPPPPPQAGTPTIPLSTLIDFIVQRTYHELNVLSELLPRKNDMERFAVAYFSRGVFIFVCTSLILL